MSDHDHGTPEQSDVVRLDRVGEELLTQARTAPAGRAARSLLPGQSHHLSQTVIALVGGHELKEHESPGEATLHLLEGRVTFHVGPSVAELSGGDLVSIPPARHSITALEDSVMLLTVLKSSR